jgi:hypothetical protein
MSIDRQVDRVAQNALARAHRRILAEIADGLRHGHFTFALTCELIHGRKRRLTLQAGKSFQFVISEDECLRPVPPKPIDSCDGSDPDAT